MESLQRSTKRSCPNKVGDALSAVAFLAIGGLRWIITTALANSEGSSATAATTKSSDHWKGAGHLGE